MQNFEKDSNISKAANIIKITIKTLESDRWVGVTTNNLLRIYFDKL